MRSFFNIKIKLMVGISGGALSSKHDIRLNDIIISFLSYNNGGVL